MPVVILLVLTALLLLFLSGDGQIDFVGRHKRCPESQNHPRKIDPEADTEPGAEQVACPQAHQEGHGQGQSQLCKEGQLRKYLIPLHGAPLPSLTARPVRIQKHMGYCNIVMEKTRLPKCPVFPICLYCFLINQETSSDIQIKDSLSAITNPLKTLSRSHFSLSYH